MKKLLLIFAACLSVVACEVYSNDDTGINRNDLMTYASYKFSNYVVAPVEIATSLLAFDSYLQLPESEKELDNRFYGKLEIVYDNIYRFQDTAKYNLWCTVDTKGTSLHDDGAVWIFAEAEIYGLNESYNYNYYGECHLPEYTQIAKTGENTWTMSYEDLFETEMKYLGDDNGRHMWEVKSTGMQQSTIGAWATFTTGDTPLTVKEMANSPDSRYNGNAYGGTYYVDIFDEDKKPLDYVQIKFNPGFKTKYITSR